MEVRNEMEIFITLTKYKTCQRCEEGNPLLVVNYLVSILSSVSNIFMRIGAYPLMFIGSIYNIDTDQYMHRFQNKRCIDHTGNLARLQ